MLIHGYYPASIWDEDFEEIGPPTWDMPMDWKVLETEDVRIKDDKMSTPR